MWSRFTSHLYVRIWMAVVATVMVLTFLVGAAWRLSTDPPQLPIREVLVHNKAGDVIGTAQTRPGRKLGDDLEFDVVTKDGQTLNLLLPRPKRPPGNPWNRPPFGFGWMLVLVGLAVALGAYPIIRRLTLRLEALQRGVERWGAGDLSARVNADGHDEVAFLAERFNHAAERIETLMESHKSLLANASHELRSPLARIRMGLELMENRAPTLVASRASGVALPLSSEVGANFPGGGPAENSTLKRSPTPKEEISRSINELDQLIDEILLASRLDARQADAEPFEMLDLTGLAAEECARVNAELYTGPDGTDAEHSVTVQGSPRLLRRLIRNLLENARRYSLGEISLELTHRGSGTHQQAVIRVNDRGPGVPAAQRERIFEPFYRLPGASEREGSVGLGLALVKSISQRHGGTVRCEARTGGGASFVVELPVLPGG
ncbi:sensor histidine kinase [Polaromonas sp.]|uniref:sensor histidine kinase n=1 Tax=Polaromonas sp. TaxID=1869339 RepID=UPI002FCB4EC5